MISKLRRILDQLLEDLFKHMEIEISMNCLKCQDYSPSRCTPDREELKIKLLLDDTERDIDNLFPITFKESFEKFISKHSLQLNAEQSKALQKAFEENLQSKPSIDLGV